MGVSLGTYKERVQTITETGDTNNTHDEIERTVIDVKEREIQSIAPG